MFIAIDAGTTRTRGWLVAGADVCTERRVTIGVGDSARDGSPERLLHGLLTLVAGLDDAAGGGTRPPILASGMIGSSLGLGHVPHVVAPAGLDDLASGLAPMRLPGLEDRPVWVVPGVRTPTADDEDPGSGDVMRGEETLCLGLLGSRALAPGDVLFSVGSHWKWIATDAMARVAASRTSMGGELVEALRTGTILSEALPGEWTPTLSRDAVAAGVDLVTRTGLPRALFEIRLHQLARSGSPEHRLGLLAGVVIGADLAHWRQPAGAARLLVTGSAPMADTWHEELSARGWPATRLATADAERAQREGLAAVGRRRGLVA